MYSLIFASSVLLFVLFLIYNFLSFSMTWRFYLIQENTYHRKPVFLHVLRSMLWWKYESLHKNNLYKMIPLHFFILAVTGLNPGNILIWFRDNIFKFLKFSLIGDIYFIWTFIPCFTDVSWMRKHLLSM